MSIEAAVRALFLCGAITLALSPRSASALEPSPGAPQKPAAPLPAPSSQPAEAAPSAPRDPAAAEALYKRGRELLTAGNWTEACAKFDASMALNPAASAMLNIAKCHEHEGKLSQALIDYKRAMQLNQDTLGDERKKALDEIARRGVANLEVKVVKLRITVREPPPGLRITRDGSEVPLGMLGETIPVDPGEHVLEATAPGYQDERRKVMFKEGESAQLEIALVPRPAASPAPASVTSAPPEKAAPSAEQGSEGPSARPATSKSGETRRGVPAWAWVAGGLGAAFAGAGIALRIDGAGAEQTLVQQCGKELLCDRSSGYDPADDNARKNRGFALFVGGSVVGAAGLGIFVFGVVTSQSKKSATAPAPLPRVTAVPVLTQAARGFAVVGAF